MKVNPFMFRNYDIRGKMNVDLNEEVVEGIGKAYGTLLNRRKIKHAVVGRDNRISGPAFQKAFVKGLITTGVNVLDLGTIMTQMMYFAQYYFQTNGGAILTASHNPYNYNGFKLAIGYSKTTEQDEVQEIKGYVENDNYFVAETPGTVTVVDNATFTEAYYKDVLKRINIKKKFKVVIDSRCGTTALYLPELLKRVGCDLVTMNDVSDGNFPQGTPDPTDAAIMGNLAEHVLKNKADIGISFDGDGDRIGVCDEKGHVLWNDILVAIFAQEILERFPGAPIIYNTLCTQVVPQVISQAGGIPIIWKTGHAFIKSKIATEHAAFGGELSGHFFFNDNAYGHDDGAYASLRILEILSDKNKTLSQVYESFPQYISSPEVKIGCPDELKKDVIKEVAALFKADFPNAKITDDTVIPNDDGSRADFEDGMIVFRYSQNGPYVTIKFEAKDEDTYLQRKKYIRRMLERFPQMIWKDELCVNLSALN